MCGLYCCLNVDEHKRDWPRSSKRTPSITYRDSALDLTVPIPSPNSTIRSLARPIVSSVESLVCSTSSSDDIKAI